MRFPEIDDSNASLRASFDSNPENLQTSRMKTTLDFPPELVRKVKLRAASEGRNLKDVAAELLQRGLEQPPPTRTVGDRPVISTHPMSGLPFVKSHNTKGFVPPTLDESLALIRQADEEQDLRRAGVLD